MLMVSVVALCFSLCPFVFTGFTMASPVPTCSMFGCPHAHTTLGAVVARSSCSAGCSVPMCEGCCRDVLRQTGRLQCIGCRSEFKSFSSTAEVTALQALRAAHKEKSRKRPARDGAADSDVEEVGWEIEAIVGVRAFSTESGSAQVFYKVAWVLAGMRNGTAWTDVEASHTWESAEHLRQEGCSLMMAEFHERFMIPSQLPLGYSWDFRHPSVRRNPLTKALEFRCAHAACQKVSEKKDDAMKHAYSEAHLKENGAIQLPFGRRSPFMCLLCPTVCCFAQKSALDKHREKYHLVYKKNSAELKAFEESCSEFWEEFDARPESPMEV
jgi:hypothetical protein